MRRFGAAIATIGFGEVVVWTGALGAWGALLGGSTVVVGLAVAGITPRALWRAVLP